jgi:hypothetical protein
MNTPIDPFFDAQIAATMADHESLMAEIDRIGTTIAQQWEVFASNCLPADAGPVQRQEMRRAFYAGFGAAVITTIHLSQLNAPGPAGVRIERYLGEVEYYLGVLVSEGSE